MAGHFTKFLSQTKTNALMKAVLQISSLIHEIVRFRSWNPNQTQKLRRPLPK